MMGCVTKAEEHTSAPVITKYTGLNLATALLPPAGGLLSAARHVTASCRPGRLTDTCCCLAATDWLLLLLKAHLLLLLLLLKLLLPTATALQQRTRQTEYVYEMG